ncbi:Hypothetical predicted protein [Mytilus galloprovincialis]|uniref:Reverse transcriptase domain-containing protein n=1 Tax=Mytilus galloprovincialis TaxID=29158 RepID=A0A8B6DV42_MYTGA|nr:Hypothetical predicted protein [Mytilus galloprovincialis]
MNCDSDGIFLLGDFNSLIGLMSEILFEADEITKRNQIDNCVNQHGHDFLEFLNESKFCVLNSRFADGANYTSISKKGKVVVDFICVPHNLFTDVEYFRVLTVQSIVDDFKLDDLIGSKSKLPDHSAIVSEFNITRHCLATQTKDPRSSCSRFKLNQIPLDFMTSDIKRTVLLNLIKQIESCREAQDNVENQEILADKQNGFRKNGSCEDHIYTLNSIVRNSKSLFVAFIDLRNCFVFIDRDMMLYKLLIHNIDGKLNNSVKSIYQNSESCVRLNGKLTSWLDC